MKMINNCGCVRESNTITNHNQHPPHPKNKNLQTSMSSSCCSRGVMGGRSRSSSVSGIEAHCRACSRRWAALVSEWLIWGLFGVIWGLFGGYLGVIWGFFGGYQRDIKHDQKRRAIKNDQNELLKKKKHKDAHLSLGLSPEACGEYS